MKIFDAHESAVRIYCRHWPTVFERAMGSVMVDVGGVEYIDFFAAAGSLNYGHNSRALRRELVAYLLDDGVTQSLDMATVAKRQFIETFDGAILRPRGLDYKMQFSGPAGTTAVEAALRLARKATGRAHVLGFSGGFHGMSTGALQVSDPRFRGYVHPLAAAGVPPLPFDDRAQQPVPEQFAVELESRRLEPADVAAVIIEIVQGEGGAQTARRAWLTALAEFCRASGILLIVDDIQAGCGRTGPFFSFEDSGVLPDVVCLSKSLSGYGLPLSLVLIRPDLDVWAPGEHTGTFRGSNLAFVTGRAGLELFWRDTRLQRSTEERAGKIFARLRSLEDGLPGTVRSVSGRGMLWGLRLANRMVAKAASEVAFAGGLLVETCGPDGDVLKISPPLTIRDDEIDRGLAVLEQSVRSAADLAGDYSDRAHL